MARFTGWRTLAALVVGLLLVLVPVGLRNLTVGGQWSISTFQAGPNFYIGNSLSADGRYRPLVPGHETPQFERRDATQIAQRDLGEALTPRQVSRYWASRCFDEIRSSPARWIRLMMLKTMMVLNAYEVGDVESQVVYARQSNVLAVLSRVWHFGTLMPLACAGLVFTWRRRRVLWVYYLLIITMVAAVALFYVLGRYRYPLVPLMIPFAAAGVVYAWRCIRDRNFRSVRLPLAAAAACFVFCNLIKVHPTDLLDASAFMNLGVAYAQRNHPDDMERATRCFDQAVEENPGSPEAHYNLALALDRRGDVHGAIRHYQAALLRAPTLIHADYNLAVALENAQRSDEALIHYRRAVTLDPADADAKAAIARIGAR